MHINSLMIVTVSIIYNYSQPGFPQDFGIVPMSVDC